VDEDEQGEPGAGEPDHESLRCGAFRLAEWRFIRTEPGHEAEAVATGTHGAFQVAVGVPRPTNRRDTMIRKINVLATAAIVLAAIACSKDKQAASDSVNLLNASRGTPTDTMSAIERTPGGTVTTTTTTTTQRTTVGPAGAAPAAAPVVHRSTTTRSTSSGTTSRGTTASGSGTTTTTTHATTTVKHTQRDAAIGAAAGAIIGATTSKNKVKGGVIGGAAGAILGGVIGNNVDKKTTKTP
jgi:hypothetical protein